MVYLLKMVIFPGQPGPGPQQSLSQTLPELPDLRNVRRSCWELRTLWPVVAQDKPLLNASRMDIHWVIIPYKWGYNYYN